MTQLLLSHDNEKRSIWRNLTVLANQDSQIMAPVCLWAKVQSQLVSLHLKSDIDAKMQRVTQIASDHGLLPAVEAAIASSKAA